jgi:hypothetical protein
MSVADITSSIFMTPWGHTMPKKVLDDLIINTQMSKPGQPREFVHFIVAIIENFYINGVRLRIDGN